MDELIGRFDAVEDRDLMLSLPHGVAYQRDMSKPVAYDAAYFDNYLRLEDQEIARKLNATRIGLVDRYAGAGCPVLDVGIGSGEFIKKRPATWGRDVNKTAVAWLRAEKKWGELGDFSAYTFWDVLEHVDVPNNYFKRMPDDSFLFTSLPIFPNLKRVRDSKHYKPNEHFYYWTAEGFIDWMARYRFRLLEQNEQETEAGRESIKSFAFKRDLPGYHVTVEQYRKLYNPNYGASAWLYFDLIASLVLQLGPKSILDFGCGRSDLAAHFWNDGRRRIAKYDPAIPQFETMPEGKFDLAICTDVMEHILMVDVHRIFADIREKASNALFTISLRPARAILPDGRNAHVTLLSESEWTRWVASVFGKAVKVPTRWDHILMLKTW